nr:LCP family protein [Pontibacillus sp. HN14]
MNESYGDEPFEGSESPEGKTNVLLLGIDQRGDESTRSDTIMIGQYDTDQNKLKLVSLMRDTYVNIPGYGYKKLNAAFALGGPELMRRTIQENFGVDLEYYSIIDFDGFVSIVNTIAPDGVTINVEKDMYYKDGVQTIDLKAGEQTLDGKELLGYARFRNDAYGDLKRVERQQKVLNTLKDEFVSFTGLARLPRALGAIQPYVKTNMGTPAILGFGTDFLIKTPDDIETFTIPKDVGYTNLRVPGEGAVLSHDEEKTKEALQSFLE